MAKLAQLTAPIFFAGALTALALIGLGCGHETAPPSPPRDAQYRAIPTAEVAVEAVADEKPEMSRAPYWPVEPVAAWTFAPDFQSFHETWLDRFRLQAGGGTAESALLPYADAVEWHGASWGIEATAVRMILQDRRGELWLHDGVEHPAGPDRPGRVLKREDRKALGWESLQEGSLIHRIDRRLEVQITGAIVADNTCLACHGYAPGELLGAIVYQFTEIADD